MNLSFFLQAAASFFIDHAKDHLLDKLKSIALPLVVQYGAANEEAVIDGLRKAIDPAIDRVLRYFPGWAADRIHKALSASEDEILRHAYEWALKQIGGSKSVLSPSVG